MWTRNSQLFLFFILITGRYCNNHICIITHHSSFFKQFNFLPKHVIFHLSFLIPSHSLVSHLLMHWYVLCFCM
jgi:hypothetical protein